MINKNKYCVKPLIVALIGGVAIAPVQSTLDHSIFGIVLTEVSAKIQPEPHTPHLTSSVTDHYIDPRTIRAVGYDNGKADRQKNGRDNWDVYNERFG